MTAAQTASEQLWAVVLILSLALALVMSTGWLLHRAAARPFPNSIIAALAILALVALLGYIAGGEDRPELAAIAGTAVGALAGATTALATRDDDG